MSSLSLLEKRKRTVAKIIDSLPLGASSVLSTLDPAIPFFQQPRPCDFCGKPLQLKKTSQPVRFCSYRCNAKWWNQFPEYKAKIHTKERNRKSGEGRKRFLHSGSPEALRQIERIRKLNPAIRPEVQAKISATHKRLGYKPRQQGGNGKGLTKAQVTLLFILNAAEWKAEVAISTKMARGTGYPTCYKVDIGSILRKIAIELDGGSHNSPKRRSQDRKKDVFLASLGWTVLRFTNQAMLDWINSETPPESSISMIFKQHDIQVLAFAAFLSTIVL